MECMPIRLFQNAINEFPHFLHCFTRLHISLLQNEYYIYMKKPVVISIAVISVLIALILIAVGVFFLLIEPRINILNAPELDMDKLTSYSRTVRILDKDGNGIDGALFDKNKVYVRIDELQPHTKNAFIAIEDKRFYDHDGVDYKRILSALASNIKHGGFREGASTITQQLIKNTHLSNEKTIKRKLNEMRLARRLEQVYSKDRILESYFNILYFGSGITGLGTASRVMFGKSAGELSLAQSAALAAIINNPSKYNPYKNSEALDSRKSLVLKMMKNQGYISDGEYSSALEEKLNFSLFKRSGFIDETIRSLSKQSHCSEKDLFLGNYTISTRYDKAISDCARAAISALPFDCNARVIVLENSTGGVACDESNCTSCHGIRRSPASTIKPFVSYAAALENGANPLTQILDEPTDFNGYRPSNYHDKYRGYLSLEDCLVYSSNIGAVKLLDSVGIENGVETAKKFGLPLVDEDKTLATALGGVTHGVTLLEIANAYRTLANGGAYSPTSYFERADGVYGDMRKPEVIVTHAVGEDTAYLLTDILCKCAKYGTAKKLAGIDCIAAKTGTNGDENGNYDCYCIAYTKTHTVAVWFGAIDNLDNTITGSTCCDVIKELFASGAMHSDKFVPPDSVGYYEVDDLALRNEHEVYLADPMQLKRFRRTALLSKRHLPIQKNIDIIDYFDRMFWEKPSPIRFPLFRER